MLAVLYGILIAFLMGLSAFAGAWVVLKLKTTSNWRPFKIVNKDKDDDAKVIEEIQKGGFEAFNLEDLPPTADATARRFTRSHSEELRDVPK